MLRRFWPNVNYSTVELLEAVIGKITLKFSPDWTKRIGGRGFAHQPAGGTHDAPPDPLVGVWGHIRRLGSRPNHTHSACPTVCLYALFFCVFFFF